MRRLLQKSRDNAALAIAKHRFPALAEDFLDCLAGGGLDLIVRIEKREIQPDGPAPSDLRPPRAHQADENDRAPRRENLRARRRSDPWAGLQVQRAPLFRYGPSA